MELKCTPHSSLLTFKNCKKKMNVEVERSDGEKIDEPKSF